MIREHNTSSKELFRRIALDDTLAFADCVRRFSPQLFPFIRSIIHDEAWAEDLLQELFLKVWKGRTTLTTIENPEAWLTRMASNLALDFIKHNTVAVKAQYRIARQYGQHEETINSSHHDLQFYKKILSEAVDQLTPAQQNVYRLRYEDDLSYEEIAAQLNISRNTVRNHLVSAMDLIRNYVREKGDFILLIILLASNRL